MSHPSEPAPSSPIPANDERQVTPNFITEVIDDDLRSGRVRQVVTRFPPEPNGYLHIGHAKAICLDFGLASDYGGRVHLRFDDTNPTTEDIAYVESQIEDIRWLGFEWDELLYASDYFEQLYRYAETLIERGEAYVDGRDEATIRATRGTVSTPGTPSADRDRSVAENLDLFRRMRAGDFKDGSYVLRAKIDLANANMLLRDPVLYRIKHAHHYRTGDAWVIYPLYDFAHPLSDAIEGISHSLCSLEYDNNRAVYDWLVSRLYDPPRPHQYEFARLQLDYTVLSKRKLIALVQEGHVGGWDDPRMPTIAGVRRRGISAAAVRELAQRVGVTKANSRTDPSLLENIVRDQLNPVAPRVMAVTDPVALLLDDPHGLLAALPSVEAPYLPADVAPAAGDVSEGRRPSSRRLSLSDRLWIERDDVLADPPAGFKRMAPGRAVRLRHGPVVLCSAVETDDDGRVLQVRAELLPDSVGRNPDGHKVWAAIHWLDQTSAQPAEFRLFGHLFSVPDPDAEGVDFRQALNPDSLVRRHGFTEPSLAADPVDTRYQFERLGYFWRDPVDGGGDPAVWNRIVTLKDGWTKAQQRQADGANAKGAKTQGAKTQGGEAAKAADQAAPATAAAVDEADPLAGLVATDRARAEAWLPLGLRPADAAILATEPALAQRFDQAVAAGAEVGLAAAWTVQELRPLLRAQGGSLPATLDGQALADLLAELGQGRLNSGTARQALAAMAAGEGDLATVVEAHGLANLADDQALAQVVDQVVAAHPSEVQAFRDGKQALIGFFVGQAMRASGGRADPKTLQRLLRQALEG